MIKFFMFLFLGIATCSIYTYGENKNSGKQLFFADPTIYTEQGKYYLSGTKNNKPLGFSILESDNLVDWSYPVSKENSKNMILTTGADVYGEKSFWAPQIFKEDNMYYLSYTASSQVALAHSPTLLGNYTQSKAEPIDGSEKNIDSYIFKDDDGKYYLYHVRFNKGNFIWVAEFDFKAGKIKHETLKQCFSNTESWEMTPAYESSPIMEGPSVIKMKGIYYLFYSANHFKSIDYGVGYATASKPFGPWTKHPGNPIIHRSVVHENGSGHGDLFFDNAKNPFYVYHVHFSDSVISPRRTRIVPLSFDMNKTTGIYNITAKAKDIIIPVLK